MRIIERDMSRVLCTIVLCALLASTSCRSIAAEPVVNAVESVAVTVANVERSRTFFRDVLGFEPVADDEVAGDAYEHLYGVFGARIHIVKMRLGDEVLQLEQFVAPSGRPIPVDSRSNDGWFQHIAIIVSDMDQAFASLREHNVAFASTAPQVLPAWNPNAGGIATFYFKDPDGHNLEVLHFPPGKGDPKWQRKTDRLFLGIDHSAIVVADTEASLRYYRNTLGMHVAGTSENYGTEQEHLNNVFGARLRITALRAGAGPGVELLEYLAPRTGKPMPIDSAANDLWTWHINMAANVIAADRVLGAGHYTYVSPGPVTLETPNKVTGLFVRDPDGHALLLESH